MTMYYAGIGSRETPGEFLGLFYNIGKYLALKGVVLRSGGAGGADTAFELGCNEVKGIKEIYLPWKDFNNSTSSLYKSKYDDKAMLIAEEYHPAWNYLKGPHKKLMTRNTYQVLGHDLKTLSDFVICWTPKGKGQGGTGQALRIAKANKIPIFDCGTYKDAYECAPYVKKFMDDILDK